MCDVFKNFFYRHKDSKDESAIFLPLKMLSKNLELLCAFLFLKQRNLIQPIPMDVIYCIFLLLQSIPCFYNLPGDKDDLVIEYERSLCSGEQTFLYMIALI